MAPLTLFCESFDWTTDGTKLGRRYDGASVTQVISSGLQRGSSGNCMRGNSSSSVTKVVTAGATRGIVAAFYSESLGGTAAFYTFAEGATTHVTIGVTSAGKIVAYRGSFGTGTLLGTAAAALPTGVYKSIEAVVTVDDTVGSIEVRVDGAVGTQGLSLSGIDTRNGGTTGQIDTLTVFVGVSTLNRVDDLIMHDGNGFKGDRVVRHLFANAAGTHSDGTASSGTLLSCVDDPDCNDDTDYISQAAAGDKSSFGLDSLPANALSVGAVMPLSMERKDDAGANSGRLLLLSGATEDDGGADESVGTSYQASQRLYTTDPDTGIAWTIAGVNAIEVGWNRTA